MDEFHDLPTSGFRKDRWVSIQHSYIDYLGNIWKLDPPIIIEHWTSCHPDNNGAYLTEHVLIDT